LLKRKLFFVHVSFASPELASQTAITYCHGAYPSDDPQCEVMPVNDGRLLCEQRDLVRRVAEIPTTFGLTNEQSADLRVFVSMLNHSHNGCFRHLWDVVADGKTHTQDFYKIASASCDETPVLRRGEVPATACDIRDLISYDVIPREPGRKLSTPREDCAATLAGPHEQHVKFLYDAKKKLEAVPRYLAGACNVARPE
jgi:hypothetical protein